MVIAVQEDTEFVVFWNKVLEPKFTRYRHILQGGLSRHSEAIFPSLGLRPGMSVLDVGCGWGDLSIQVAEAVGPAGHVLGIDCVEAFLVEARKDAAAKGLRNVEFQRGDAEIALPGDRFDYAVSRFGTMFFVNPVAGLRRMRLSLKPGGTMTHIVWRTKADNPAWHGPEVIALNHLPPPGADADTCGPGPFSMANEETARLMMKSAGYTDISFDRVDAKVMLGRTPDECVEYSLALGPAGEVFREAGELGEARRAAIEDEMRAFFETQERDDAGVWARTSSWVITGRNPG